MVKTYLRGQVGGSLIYSWLQSLSLAQDMIKLISLSTPYATKLF